MRRQEVSCLTWQPCMEMSILSRQLKMFGYFHTLWQRIRNLSIRQVTCHAFSPLVEFSISIMLLHNVNSSTYYFKPKKKKEYLFWSSYFICNWRTVWSPNQVSLCLPVGGVNVIPTSLWQTKKKQQREKVSPQDIQGKAIKWVALPC